MSNSNMFNVNEKKQNKWGEMFPNIAGYDKIREECAQIIDIIQRKEEYIKVGARCPRGWLFYGDPGMGKTRIVKDIAHYVNYPIVEISSSDAIKRKMTIDEDIVNGFAEAIEKGKSIIFIDEMDKFAGYRKYLYEVPDNLKTQKILLHELDQIKDLDDIIVIATANERSFLGEAILRSGRFDRQVLFDYPNAEDRSEIIKHFLKNAKLAKEVLIHELVKMTAGCSCAEIECMVNEAKISAVSKQNSEIVLPDFTAALNRIIFNDIPKDDSKSNEQQKLVAYHEVGHAYMGYLLQPKNLHQASIIPQGKAVGKVKMNGDDDFVKDKQYYEELVKIALAGMLSVKVMTGIMTSGNQSDIQNAFEIALKMVNEGFYGFEYVSITINKSSYDYSRLLADSKAQKLIEIVKNASDEVEKILMDNKDVLEKLAVTLVDKKELSNSEIVSIIENKSDI